MHCRWCCWAFAKDDLGCSAAELVYGTTLRLPGEFFEQPSTSPESPSVFLDRLRRAMSDLRAVPTSKHRELQAHVPRSLSDCSFVFVRTDSHRTPLQRPYEGPFKVLDRTPKYFRLDLGTRTDNVSIDRLKPAFIDEELLLPTPTFTRAGRLVRVPDRLNL